MQTILKSELIAAVLAMMGIALLGETARATEDLSHLDKGHRLLIQNGLQVIGLVSLDDAFHESTYQNANYSSVLWWGGSNPSAAPDMPWVRSVIDPSTMPDLTPSESGAYMSKMVALSLGDEQDLNDRHPGGIFDRSVQWFQSAQSNPAYANTILYVNNWGSQIPNPNLDDFLAQAKPDMISFDTYPWITGQDPTGGSPTDWYNWTRKYRVYANAAGIPYGLYRQTYHSTGDGRRDPSPSEQNLSTMAPLAFGATYLADFTYNTGASSMFGRDPADPAHGTGDNRPTALYYQQATLNLQARNLGKALVRLKQVDDHAGETFPGNGSYSQEVSGHTTSMMILRGKHLDASNNVAFNDLPAGFANDPSTPMRTNAGGLQEPDPTKFGYTDWVAKVNDPYLNGGFVLNGPTNYGVRNLGTKNNGLAGDVILSWFKLLDESFDGPNYTDERYLMIVNGLTGPDGTAADFRQEILLDFLFPAATGITMLQRLDENTGQVYDVPLTPQGSNRWRLTLDLDGGMGALFKFKDGAPFVGIQSAPEPSALALLSIGGIALLRRRRR